MPDMNRLSTTDQVRWVLRDDATGKTDMDASRALAWRISPATPS